jgi:hypothetical protein
MLPSLLVTASLSLAAHDLPFGTETKGHVALTLQAAAEQRDFVAKRGDRVARTGLPQTAAAADVA